MNPTLLKKKLKREIVRRHTIIDDFCFDQRRDELSSPVTLFYRCENRVPENKHGSPKVTEGTASQRWNSIPVPITRFTTVVPSTCGLTSHGLSHPQSTVVWKYYMENSRNKQVLSFKLCTVPKSVMKFVSIPPPNMQGLNHHFVQRIHAVYTPNC